MDEYLNKTEERRRMNNETQLLLSYIQPHKQVMRSTISDWIKNVLKSSGINVSLFTAHSTPSATTSKGSASVYQFFCSSMMEHRFEDCSIRSKRDFMK